MMTGSISDILCVHDQGPQRLCDIHILNPGKTTFEDAIIENYLTLFKAQHFRYSKGIAFTLQLWGKKYSFLWQIFMSSVFSLNNTE
jgi:hypothetical protein